jgi:hypothetical protein
LAENLQRRQTFTVAQGRCGILRFHPKKLFSIAQFEPGPFRRWLTLVCVMLVLCFSAIEATHSHPEAQITGSGTHCVICISVHGSAPAATFHLNGIALTVISVTTPLRIVGTASAPEISLFTRPPPVA